jgi:hypothetical protein
MTAPDTFNIGEVVRIARIPPAVREAPAETRRLFERAAGCTFVVRGFSPYGHVELDVSKIERQNKIWVEPDCLQLFRRRPRRQHRK